MQPHHPPQIPTSALFHWVLMRQILTSPYPRILRGGDEALEELADLDKDISHVESMVLAFVSSNSSLH
jgi:hypothetical protein